MDPLYQAGTVQDPNGILIDPSRTFTDTVTIVSGQNLAAGAVLGAITASGKFTLSLAAAEDGSEVATVILAKAVDASAGDKSGLVYLAGDFDGNKLTFGAGHTADTLRHALAARGLFVHRSIAA